MKRLKLFSIIVALVTTYANANGQGTLYTNGDPYYDWICLTNKQKVGVTYLINVMVSGKINVTVNQIVDVPASSTIWQPITVTASSDGYFQIDAYNLTSGGSFTLGYMSVYYDNEAPSTPKLNVVNVGTNNFTISANSTDQYLYRYYFEITQGGALINNGWLSAGSLSQYNLNEGTKYNVSVKAYDLAGNESEEGKISVTTANSVQAPTNLKAAVSYEKATLSWSSVYGATKYEIYKGNSRVDTVTGTSYTITGLDINTSYNYKVRAANNYSSSQFSSIQFRTKDIVITGPSTLCSARASYAIKDFDASVFNVTNISWSTSTVKATNGSGYSTELQKVADGEGWISYTVKSKSTQKAYTRKYTFTVGTPISDINFPTETIYMGQTYRMSMKKTYPGCTYTWDLNVGRITSGQGTGSISFVVDLTPARSAKLDEDSIKYRSSLKRKPSPNPTNPKQPVYNIRGSVTTKNACNSAGITSVFTIPYPAYNRDALIDSVEAVAFAEEVLSSIKEGTVSEEKSFVVYPNPANSIINVSHPFEKATINSIDVFDVSGGKHISESYTGEIHSTTVDISALPNGTYILIVNQNGNAQACTFIKQ